MKFKLLSFAFFVIALSDNLMSQTSSYSLNWTTPQNFYVTCGSTNQGWTVNSIQTCYLYTPILLPANNENGPISYSFRVNQTGNGKQEYDTFRLEVKVSNSPWYVEKTIFGTTNNNVHYEISGTLQAEVTNGDYIAFRLKAVANTSSFTWTLKKDNFAFNVDNVTTTNTYLPISLASFSGNGQNNYAHIEWVTFSEVNNDYFTIERSENNIQFYPVGNVNGAGNSNLLLKYRFDDPVELTSSVTYYRLRQTDYDGTTEVTNPIAVKKSSGTDHDIWYYFENSTMFINYTTDIDEDITLFIYDICGKLLYRKVYRAGKGNNTLSLNLASTNSVKGGGMYIFSIIDALSVMHCMKVVI